MPVGMASRVRALMVRASGACASKPAAFGLPFLGICACALTFFTLSVCCAPRAVPACACSAVFVAVCMCCAASWAPCGVGCACTPATIGESPNVHGALFHGLLSIVPSSSAVLSPLGGLTCGSVLFFWALCVPTTVLCGCCCWCVILFVVVCCSCDC